MLFYFLITFKAIRRISITVKEKAIVESIWFKIKITASKNKDIHPK